MNQKEIRGRHTANRPTLRSNHLKALPRSIDDMVLIIAGLFSLVLMLLGFPSFTIVICVSVAAGMFICAGLMGVHR